MSAGERRRHRGRQSRIDGLPPQIVEHLHRLLRSGVSQRAIIEALRQPLAEIGERPLSVAGLSRYASRIEQVAGHLRERRAIADALIAQLGDEATGRLGDLNVELLRSAVFDLAGENLDAAQASTLALAAQRLERTARDSQQRRIELRREMAVEAAEIAATTGREQGLSKEAVAALRAAVEGIA